MKRRCTLLVSAALLLSGGVAAAQDISAAKALFEKGVEDLQAGKLDTACPALAGESYRMDPRPGTLFTLADCFDRAGTPASATARYEDYLNPLRPDDARRAGQGSSTAATGSGPRATRQAQAARPPPHAAPRRRGPAGHHRDARWGGARRRGVRRRAPGRSGPARHLRSSLPVRPRPPRR